ncbi:leucine-rich repeat domain-containing protein [Chamaesiphon sp. VAR_48_metabat_403]|uniref:leucine-rich repeat domain-containing protein n=1 Tax=Chamaesiphon sp. VAR_48_metabat_403 TaxID=2964700 RepID=UPI00286E9387|nr:leucine-rich repeat domain-containing protein [Chamaesiphon sp. VAR_48_metabat_403]
MKKFLISAVGIGFLSQLISCSSTSSPVKLDGAIPPTNSKSFFQWCQDKQSSATATRLTIDVLLREAGTNDCRLADAKLKSVTSLDLYYSQISDLQPLAGFNNLTTLDLIGNKISDLQPLAGLKNLTFLSLSKNQIRDIRPLAQLKNLTFLGLSKNQITDIQSLAGLSNLISLKIDENQIEKQVCPLELEYTCVF